MTKKIAIVGGGNMARALIGGLIQAKISPDCIDVVDHNQDKLQRLKNDFGVCVHSNLGQWVAQAHTLVMAVKPQVMALACKQVLPFKAPDALVVSIAAGIRIEQFKDWMQTDHVVRAMPNTPSMVGAGVVGLYIPQSLNETMAKLARSIMPAMGEVIEVDSEEQLDWLSTVPGSGPAYVFRLIEALEEAMTRRGFEQSKARKMAVMTIVGAGQLALLSQESPTTLRENVTSKGGTTAQALRVMDEHGFMQMMDEAVQAAYDRNQELAEQLKSA